MSQDNIRADTSRCPNEHGGFIDIRPSSFIQIPPLSDPRLTHICTQYTASVKTSTLEPTAKALASLASSFKSDPKLASILTAPTLSSSDKSGIISELMKSASVNASSKEGATVKNFLETLAENNRLSYLEGACEKFGELMSAQRGEVELRVTSAAPLDQKVLKQLEGAVSKSRFVGQGKKLKVVSRVSFVVLALWRL